MAEKKEEKAGEVVETESGKPETKKRGRAKREKKEVVRKRKALKEREDPLSAALRLAVESGKVEFGSRSGVKDLLLGKTKMVLVAKNAPKALREDVEKYGKLSRIPVVEYPGTSMEMGSICGKPFPVLVLTVRNEGVSNILDFAKKK